MKIPRVRSSTHATVVAYIALGAAVLALSSGAFAADAGVAQRTGTVKTKVAVKVKDTPTVRVKCPKGWTATGGGYKNPGVTYISQPLVKNGKPVGWVIQADSNNFDYKSAWAVCVNHS